MRGDGQKAAKQGWPGAGLAFGLILLVVAEGALHSDAFMHRMRGVFAAGRAFDKVMFVENRPPCWLVLGNSRMDNGVDPRTLMAAAGSRDVAFNLGLPGANATALLGIVRRLDDKGLISTNAIRHVIIGVDEGLLQAGDTLGYQIFFGGEGASGTGLAEQLQSRLRLWGFAGNLKQLREPAKLIQFVRALVEPVEPVGGGAGARMGYRPGFGGAQDADQVSRQEAGSTSPPDERVVADFFAMVDLLEAKDVSVSVVFPPLLHRRVLYLSPEHPAAGPYRDILARLRERGLEAYALPEGEVMSASEFVNPGHLNDLGAQRFSTLLGRALATKGVAQPMGLSLR